MHTVCNDGRPANKTVAWTLWQNNITSPLPRVPSDRYFSVVSHRDYYTVFQKTGYQIHAGNCAKSLPIILSLQRATKNNSRIILVKYYKACLFVAPNVCSKVIGKGQIPLRYPGRRQVRGWSQTCSELEFGLSSSELVAS